MGFSNGCTSGVPLQPHPQMPGPVPPLLKSIPGPFLLVYLQKRARSSLNGVKGSKHLRNATVEVAEVPAGSPQGSRSPESRGRAATGAWRLLGPEQGTGRMSPETWREATTSTHVQMRSGHHGQWE